MNRYKLTTNVQNGLGVLARITIMLRKFNVNVEGLDVVPLNEEKTFYDLHWIVDSTKNEDEMMIVARKVERLVPVIKTILEKLPEGSY